MKVLLLLLIGVLAVQADSKLLENFSAGSNQFTAEVYKELLKSNTGSFSVCPLSAEIVLALVHAGAGGETARQLAAGLHLPESKEKIQETIRKLAPHLEGNENYTLSSANKVYVKKGFKIKPDFKQVAVDTFAAEIENIDFDKAEEAKAIMNQWVEEKTHDKIKNLIDSVSKDSRSILINAMYFRGKWVTKFDKDVTRKTPFYPNAKDQVEVDMMEQTSRLSFFESSELNAKFLQLPYAGEDITMTFVLPNDKEGLSALEDRIADVFATPNYYSPLVHVVIPKFTIETTIQFRPILESLGVTVPFSDSANFNGILVNQPLKISKVVQKTFIEVEEEGTTAAAATYVDMVVPVSTHYQLPRIEQFIADHPFIFYIKIKDIVFFAGRYTSRKN